MTMQIHPEINARRTAVLLDRYADLDDQLKAEFISLKEQLGLIEGGLKNLSNTVDSKTISRFLAKLHVVQLLIDKMPSGQQDRLIVTQQVLVFMKTVQELVCEIEFGPAPLGTAASEVSTEPQAAG